MRQLGPIAEQALRVAGSLHPEYAEAYVEHASSQSFPIEQGKFNGGGFSDVTGVRIRILKNKRLYTLSTNGASPDNLRELASRYKTFSGLDTSFATAPVEKASFKSEEKKKLEDGDLLADLTDFDDAVEGTRIVKYRSIYGSRGRSETCFMNSDGTEISGDVGYAHVFLIYTIGIGQETRQRMIQFGGTGGYEAFKFADTLKMTLDEITALKNVIEKGVTLSDAALKKVKNVVVAPEITGIAVHESVGHPDEADRIFGRESSQAGLSYLTLNKLGMKIGSSEATIIDNPTLKGSYGYYEYDDEGVRARPKVMVDKGYQKELLTNRAYAHLLKAKSNGSARSDSYANEPLVRMSNSYVERGTANLDELLGEAKDGVYMKNFMEWNIDDTRSFSRYQGNEAYLIKNGAIDKPIKNFKLERGTLEFWNAVKMRSNEFELHLANCGKGEPMQGLAVTMGGPSMLLSFGR